MAFLKHIFPPAAVWMRLVMRLALAAVIAAAGFTHVAVIVSVLAFMPLVGFVEVQVAKTLASKIGEIGK